MPLKAIRKAVDFAFGDGGSVKARVLRGAMWVGASEVSVAVLNFARSVMLARLLSPATFGLMNLAMIVVRAIETFTRPGVAQALIARQQSFEAASSTAFTLLVARGALLAILLAAIAPLLARFYEQDSLAPILQTLAVVFVIGSFNNINTIARQRELDFRRLTYLGQTTNFIGTIVTVAMAYWLRSVWALVIGQVVQVSLNMLLSYYFVGGQVRFAFDRAIARELLSYGKFITGSSLVLYIATELDSAVIGKMLGAEQLGFYGIAFTLAHLVTTNLSKMASGIMMPAYSKLQSDIPALRNANLRTLSLVVFLVFPATAGLIVVSEPLFFVIYGDQWVAAAIPARILAVFGLFRALAALGGYLFEGMGLPKVAFQVGLIRLAVIVPLMIPMINLYGLAGAAMTVTLGVAMQWFATLYFLRLHVETKLMQVARVLWRPLWTASVMAVVVYFIGYAVNTRTLLGLAAAVLGGVLVYGALNIRFLISLKNERFQ